MKKTRLLSVLIMLIWGINVSVAQNASYKDGDKIETYTEDFKGFSFTVLSANDFTARCVGTTRSGEVVIPATVIDKWNNEFQVKEIDLQGCISLKEGKLIISEGIEGCLPDGFNKTQLKSIYFPSTFRVIEKTRLATSPYLETIVVDDRNPYLMSDGNNTMIYDKIDNGDGKTLYAVAKYIKNVSLTEVNVPYGIENIDEYSFSGGEYEIINLPASFNDFGNVIKTINETTVLREINVNPNNQSFCSVNGIVYSKDMKTLVMVPRANIEYNGTFDIPQSTIAIADGACYKCVFGTVLFNNVKTIGSEAFSECYRIREINIGPNVELIGRNAFFNCANLWNVSIGDKVTEISDGAFSGCKKLDQFTIGKDVSTLGEAFLAGCSKLQVINVDESNPYFASDNGIVYTKDLNTLIICPSGRIDAVTNMPNKTTVIGPGAFKGCSFLDNIILGTNVKTIEKEAFSEMPLLGTINISPSVEHIGTSAFQGSSISKITIGKNVREIASRAFYKSNIGTMEFEASSCLEQIDTLAFYGANIPSITLPKSLRKVGFRAFYDSNIQTFELEPGSLLSEIGEQCFLNSKLKAVRFSDADRSCELNILTSAFQGSTELAVVKLPSSLKTIGTSAFDGCVNLTDVIFADNDNEVVISPFAFRNTSIEKIELPKNLLALGNGVFSACNKLTFVDIPASTKSIGAQAFIYCTSLTNINVHPENTTYATSDGMLCNKDKTKLLIFPGGKSNDKFTLLSPSFTEIGDSAFYYCQNLKNITIPKKVKRIGKFAFHQCKALNKVIFLTDEPVTDVGINAFGYSEGYDIRSEAEFLQKNVTITVRKNGREIMYDSDERWKNSKKTYSFIGKGDVNEYLPTGRGDALLLASNSTKHSTVIPATISDGQNTYRVSVGDYAFEDIDPAVKEIIFEGPVDYMGACAFKDFETQTSNIENVFLTTYDNLGVHELSTNRFDLPAEKYQTIFSSGQQHIYVPKSVEDTFKEDWTSHADNISYKIPGIKIGSMYGTFSREFDVDLEDEVDGENVNWNQDANRPSVIAFSGYLESINPREGYTYIRMRSINCKEKSDISTGNGDGTYIPAKTGVLLRAYTADAKTPEGFYYRIGEKRNVFNKPTNNIMMEVTEQGFTIQPYEGLYTNYIISGGQYHALEVAADIPVHKSYMHILDRASEGEPPLPLMMIFDDEDDTTGIEEINSVLNESSNDVIYNLNGQRVNGNAKGIVIKNGKRYLVK